MGCPLWRRVCLLSMLLALTSAVFLGSEPLGTRNHILLSQIWDFPFRPLLRLALRYSTPSPHGLSRSTTVKSKSKSHCDWRSVSQSVLASSPIWGSWPEQLSKLSVIVGFLLYRLESDLMENTSVAHQWIYANNIEKTASSTVVFTAPLHRNGSYPIVACVFVVAGIRLRSRCLAVGLHVTITMRA
jgi:hypothetical protein